MQHETGAVATRRTAARLRRRTAAFAIVLAAALGPAGIVLAPAALAHNVSDPGITLTA